MVQPVTASLKLSWTVTSPVGDAGRGEAAVREVTATPRAVGVSCGLHQEGMGAWKVRGEEHTRTGIVGEGLLDR